MNNYIQNILLNLPPYAWNLTIAGTAIFLGVILKLIVTRLFNYFKNNHLASYSLWRSVIINLATPLNYFIPLLTLNFMLPLMQIADKYYFPLSKTLEIALILAFSSILIRSLKIFEDHIYYTYDLQKADNLKERKIRTQLEFLRKLLIVIIVLLTIAAILLSFDRVREIGTGLLAGVGIGGIIIGFAAQKSLANLLAGFQIALTQPIRIDDVLVVEGEWGRVEEITLTYVVIKIWDERRLILPINYFIEKPFQNWTRVSANILGTVFLYLDYSIPLDDLRAEFTRLLTENKLWDKRVNVLQVTDTKESTIEIRALMSASNSPAAFDLRCYIRENLIKYIQLNYPQSLPNHRVTLKSDNKVHI